MYRQNSNSINKSFGISDWKFPMMTIKWRNIKVTSQTNCYLRITMKIYTGINWGVVCFQIIAVKSTEDETSHGVE